MEQYGALGIAIAAALNRFAPFHALRVVQAWTEMEEAAEPMRPELFILDLDPPPHGEVEFFNRLRTRYPHARVLAIAAGTSAELRAERGEAGAVQFIEKPFDLSEFGATVQALLGPWDASPSGKPRGTLRDLDIIDIVQLKCLALDTALVRLETAEGDVGEIHFHHGEIFHATAGERSGAEAFAEIIRWREGELSEHELPPGAPRTIDQPWAQLLLQAVRETQSKIAPAPSVEPVEEVEPPAASSPPPPPPPEPSKTILVIDDTEMLLIFASDVLATADRTHRILTAPTGTEGLALALAHRPDLVLLDYSLTDVNGDEVCRCLLANEATSRIPVLMMSGHLPELSETASKYRNVVATLAKPFLSGALINEVEKILAAGPLPKAVSPPMAPPEVPAESHLAPSLPNGHGNVPHDDFPPESAPEEMTTPVGAAVAVAVPEPPAASSARPPMLAPEPMGEVSTALPTDEREVTVTAAYEVISVKLGTDFRMSALQIRPAQPTVTVKMDPNSGSVLLPPDRDFLAGTVELNSEGLIATLRLIPTSRSASSFASSGDFSVGRVSAESGPGEHLHLSGTKGPTMRVQLVATFQLVTVDLSQNFEVAGVVLQAQTNNLTVQAGDYSALAMRFEIEQVQLDPAGRLASLLVKARP